MTGLELIALHVVWKGIFLLGALFVANLNEK